MINYYADVESVWRKNYKMQEVGKITPKLSDPQKFESN